MSLAIKRKKPKKPLKRKKQRVIVEMYQLRAAEELDQFFGRISQNEMNLLARSNLSYLPAKNYTESWIENTHIVTMNPTAEAGMPHTRPPNIICMPIYFPESKKSETLAHEFVHIHQRRNTDAWNRFFQKEGWSRVDPYELPDRLVARCRMNPDTIDQPFWAWKNQFVALPLFEREDKPDLRHVAIRWLNLETKVHQSEAPRSFLERYGYPSQPEHPREISAVQLAPYVKSSQDINDYLSR
jgi:hypothetical protein